MTLHCVLLNMYIWNGIQWNAMQCNAMSWNVMCNYARICNSVPYRHVLYCIYACMLVACVQLPRRCFALLPCCFVTCWRPPCSWPPGDENCMQHAMAGLCTAKVVLKPRFSRARYGNFHVSMSILLGEKFSTVVEHRSRRILSCFFEFLGS